MESKAVAASACWSWFREGWRLFSASPGMWTYLSGVWFLTALVLTMLPFGGILWWLLGPVVYAGFLFCASELHQGRALQVSHVFRAFIDPHTRWSLVTVGALTAGGYLIMSLIVANIGGATGPSVQVGEEVQATISGALILNWVLRLVLATLISAMVSAALIYSCPLILFTGMEGFEALMNSVEACAKNWRPLLAVAAVYLFVTVAGFLMFQLPRLPLMGLVLTLPVIAVAVLVVAPVAFCASYVSYKSIYS